MLSIDLTRESDPIGTCPDCRQAVLQYTDAQATTVHCPSCGYRLKLDPQTRVRGAVYLRAHLRNPNALTD